MKLYQIWFEIKWFFRHTMLWGNLIVFLFVPLIFYGTWKGLHSNALRNCLEARNQRYLASERKELLGIGKVITLRHTGRFNVYDTELKFEDGTILMLTYRFVREHNIKEGGKYKIWRSSIYGFRCEEME